MEWILIVGDIKALHLRWAASPTAAQNPIIRIGLIYKDKKGFQARYRL